MVEKRKKDAFWPIIVYPTPVLFMLLLLVCTRRCMYVFTCIMPVCVCMVHAYTCICVWFGFCVDGLISLCMCRRNFLFFACVELHVLALHIDTWKVVTASSLQLSAVVLPQKLLKMVSEMSLVQLLDPQ